MSLLHNCCKQWLAVVGWDANRCKANTVDKVYREQSHIANKAAKRNSESLVFELSVS